MDFEPWAGQYLHYPWSEGVSITATGQEPPVGFEPTTARLRIESSTTELRWRPPNLAACCTRYNGTETVLTSLPFASATSATGRPSFSDGVTLTARKPALPRRAVATAARSETFALA